MNFYPLSPYGVAKLYAHWITINYKEAYNIFACNGILFNHESPRRGETFVTRKITRGLTRIHYGLEDSLYMGNLNSKRDWGHAKDYVYMQWLMLQQEVPEDFVISTGKMITVREFIEKCALELGWDIKGNKGIKINKSKNLINEIEYFFAEDQGRYLIEINKENLKEVTKILDKNSVHHEELGIITQNDMIINEKTKVTIDELKSYYTNWLTRYMS